MTDLYHKPMWLLTDAELDQLPDPEQRRAREHQGYLKKTGVLALLLANPEGTVYETVPDAAQGWKLRPVAGPLTVRAIDAIRAVCHADDVLNSDEFTKDFSVALDEAVKKCRDVLADADRPLRKDKQDAA